MNIVGIRLLSGFYVNTKIVSYRRRYAPQVVIVRPAPGCVSDTTVSFDNCIMCELCQLHRY